MRTKVTRKPRLTTLYIQNPLQIILNSVKYSTSSKCCCFYAEKIPLSAPTQGFTTWKDELYVVGPHSPDINVYDIETLGHRRNFTVKGLVDGWDIVVHANVLYVSEYKDKLIHRIQLSDETSSHWSVDSEYLKMSMNKKGNVVVSCWDLYKIIEYTPTGSCVREIQVNAIDRNIAGLYHAIQLDDNLFVICHATTTTHHRVCMIDSSGRIMKSYGGGAGSGIGQMNNPCYLAIDRNGFILVDDHNNNRIIQLDCIAGIHQRIHSWICWSGETEKNASTRENKTSVHRRN